MLASALVDQLEALLAVEPSGLGQPLTCLEQIAEPLVFDLQRLERWQR